MTQLHAGQTWTRTRKEVKRDEAILNHIKDFDSSNIGEFLDIMAVVTSQDKSASSVSSEDLESFDDAIDGVLKN
jgi:hypothetical protein